MAIIDAVSWQAGVTTVTGADLVAISTFCSEVSEILTAQLWPIIPEPVTLTLRAFDAPYRGPLLLPRPVRSLSAVYYKYGANGDSSGLTAADLLAAGTDYYLERDDKINDWSRCGFLWRRGASNVWGAERRFPVEHLGYTLEPAKGAVFVSGEFGYPTVPAAVVNAARTAVTLMFNSRITGAPAVSESWGGYSRSLSGPFTAVSAVESPAVQEILRRGGFAPVHIA